MCQTCTDSRLSRGDVIEIKKINANFIREAYRLRENVRGIILPFNEYFRVRDIPEHELHDEGTGECMNFITPSGQQVPYFKCEDDHLVVVWANNYVMGLNPLVRPMEIGDKVNGMIYPRMDVNGTMKPIDWIKVKSGVVPELRDSGWVLDDSLKVSGEKGVIIP